MTKGQFIYEILSGRVFDYKIDAPIYERNYEIGFKEIERNPREL